MPHPQPAAFIESFETRDVEAIAGEGDGWRGGIVQLTRGPLGYRTVRLHLPGVEVRWHACEQALLSTWCNERHGLSLGWFTEAPAAPKYAGCDIPEGCALFQFSGREHQVLHPAGVRLVEIEVSSDVVIARGWRMGGDPLPALAPALTDALEAVGLRVRAEVEACGDDGPDEQTALALRDEVLDAMERTVGALLLGPYAEPPLATTRAHELTRAAMLRMREASFTKPICVRAIAADIGVSERTLYQAFRTTVGIGPYEFNRLERVHAFRRALADGRPFHGKITTDALRTGFTDASRLASFYRRQFGETPRQTLRRWSESGATARIS